MSNWSSFLSSSSSSGLCSCPLSVTIINYLPFIFFRTWLAYSPSPLTSIKRLRYSLFSDIILFFSINKRHQFASLVIQIFVICRCTDAHCWTTVERFYIFECISWTIKHLISLMNGVTMKTKEEWHFVRHKNCT